MNRFGEKLRSIRKREGLTFEGMGKKLNISKNSYYNIEKGVSSAQAPTVKKIMNNKALKASDRKKLKELSKIKVEAIAIEITESDRLEYRKRKNASYFKERTPLRQNTKQAKSKGVVQRIFF